MKKKITESQLRKMIAESIKRTLNEIGDTEAGQWMLGRLAGRKRLTWDDYDRYHCEDDKNVNPFMNGYDWEDTPRWAEDLSQQYDDAGKPDEFYDAYWKQKDYLDNYADSMKSKIRANAMKGKTNPVAESNKRTIKESELKNIIAETVSASIKKLCEEYDPWMNGDASYIDGKYNINGEPVEINTRLSYVAIGDEYYFQGDEADDIIKTIAKIWADGNMNQEDAIAKWINLYL